MTPDLIRIGIADDHNVVRAGLRELLVPRDGFEVVGEASDGRSALEMVRRTKPNVLLLDVTMQPQNGMEAMTRIRAAAPLVGILIFSGHPAARYAERLMQQGASGYLEKTCKPEELVSAVRQIAVGGRLTETKKNELAKANGAVHTGAAPHEALSRREFQIFLRLAAGKSVGAIAESISVSPVTVTTYRRRLCKKMGLATSSEFMRYALAHGLLA